MPKSPANNSSKKEKRLRQYRKTCPAKLRERIERAATQRLYLIQRTDEGPQEAIFSVLGSTGNVYQVTLSHVPTCSCPDFIKKQDLCKHILFILIKVIGIEDYLNNPLAFQRAYISSELEQLFEQSRNRQVGGAVLANPRVIETFAASPGKQQELYTNRRSLDDNPDCPICFDPIPQNNAFESTYCQGACGANFHADCMRRWIAAQRMNSQPTCPNCRSVWVSEATAAAAAANRSHEEEGYVNLGALQGQSPIRDTSTYHYSNSRYNNKRGRYRW